MIDLHTHSTVSDGSDDPERIPELAAAAGCEAFALTDHDSLAGHDAARARAAQLDIEFVPGCEISCQSPFGGLHLLSYFVEAGDNPLHQMLAELQASRRERNLSLVARLADIGIPVTLEELEREAGGTGAGRPHAAAIMMRKGIVGSIQEAFDRYLADGGPGHVGRRRPDAADAVHAVLESGGLPVLAHPLRLKLSPDVLGDLVGELAALGVVGLEAYYSRHTAQERTELLRLAASHGMVATGGSDYHGTFKPDLSVGTGPGDLDVPGSVLDELRARRR